MAPDSAVMAPSRGADAVDKEGRADSPWRAAAAAVASRIPSDSQDAAAVRLSLDCGVGIGPSPPGPPPPRAPRPNPASLSFARLAPLNTTLAFMTRASADTGSAAGDTGGDSPVISDGSYDAHVMMRGCGAAAAVTAVEGAPVGSDLTTADARHQISRALRGRASLDAMLMLGALVRAADEAGLAVSSVGGAPRLERIESGDLPPGEDGGHADRQTPLTRKKRQQNAGPGGMVAAAGERPVAAEPPRPRPEWCAEAEPAGAPRPVRRSQRRAMRWPPLVLNGSTGGSSGGTGLGRRVDLDFTFSPPTAPSSVRQSVDTISRAQQFDLALGLAPQPTQPQAIVAAGGGGGQLAAADSNQLLELFMQLVTNCSTVGDNDLGSNSDVADPSSAGTGTGTGTTSSSRIVTGTGQGGTTARALALPPPVVHRRPVLPKSGSERQRYYNGRRWPAGGGADGGPGSARPPNATPAAAAAAAAAALRLEDGDGGGSDPIMRLHHRSILASGGAGSAAARGSGGGRRNSWDTLAGSSNSAVAMAAAAAAALAAAGLLRASTGSRTAAATGAGGGGGGGGGGGSASRFWPVGGVLQEDSGPASLLLVGALSGGMSLGGTASATSLLKLPTGSGSVRDVLSRIHHQQHITAQEGAPGGGTSSSSWSAHTGLASLFDAHLMAALRRTGAVHTFKRAMGDAAALSRASSATNSQITMTANLGRQDNSLSLTSGLMMLNFGSTAGSKGTSGVGSGGGGVSHLGVASVASAAAAAAAAAGLRAAAGLTPPHVRQATISSVSTINSNSAAGGGGGGRLQTPLDGARGGGDGGIDHGDVRRIGGAAVARAAVTAEPATASRPVHPISLLSDGAFEPPAASPAQPTAAQAQLWAFVEGPYTQRPQQQRLSCGHVVPTSYPHSYTMPRTQPEVREPGPQGQQGQSPVGHQAAAAPGQAAQAGGAGGGIVGGRSSVAVAAATAAVRTARTTSMSDQLPGHEEQVSLSLALGLASGMHGGGGGGGSFVVHASSGAFAVPGSPHRGGDGGGGGGSSAITAGVGEFPGDAGAGSAPRPSYLPSQSPEAVATRRTAGGGLASGTVSAA